MIGFCIDLRPDFAFVSMLTVALRTIPNGALMKCNFRNADLNQMFCFGFIPWILIEPIVVVVLTTQLSDLSSTGSKGSDENCLTGQSLNQVTTRVRIKKLSAHPCISTFRANERDLIV